MERSPERRSPSPHRGVGPSIPARARFPLVLAASLASGLLTPLPTLASILDVKVNAICRKSANADQRAKYCGAAKDNQTTYGANRASSAVWAGVSATCALACSNAVGRPLCAKASIAGAVGEGIATKKFVAALIGEGEKLGAKGLKSLGGGETAAKTEGAAAGKGGEACTTAATTGLKAFDKNANANKNEKSIDELRAHSAQLDARTGGGFAFATGNDSVLKEGAGGANGAAAAATAANSLASICAEGAIASARGAIRCALKTDPSIPPEVGTEGFLRDLAKATGKSPDAYFAEFTGPGPALLDSTAARNLTPPLRQSLAESLAGMQSQVGGGAPSDRSVVATAGSSGGAGAPSPGRAPALGGDDFDANAALASMLKQLAPTEGTAPPAGEARAPATSIPHRAPAAVNPEDRALSLFDRVRWRYGAIAARGKVGAELAPTAPPSAAERNPR